MADRMIARHDSRQPTARRRDPDQQRVGRVRRREHLVQARDDRDVEARDVGIDALARPGRIDDRHDLVASVADDAIGRLGAVRSELALGQDDEASEVGWEHQRSLEKRAASRDTRPGRVRRCGDGPGRGRGLAAVSFDVAAEAYDRFMGRYSRLLSPQLADLAGVQGGQRVARRRLRARRAHRGARGAAGGCVRRRGRPVPAVRRCHSDAIPGRRRARGARRAAAVRRTGRSTRLSRSSSSISCRIRSRG